MGRGFAFLPFPRVVTFPFAQAVHVGDGITLTAFVDSVCDFQIRMAHGPVRLGVEVGITAGMVKRFNAAAEEGALIILAVVLGPNAADDTPALGIFPTSVRRRSDWRGAGRPRRK